VRSGGYISGNHNSLVTCPAWTKAGGPEARSRASRSTGLGKAAEASVAPAGWARAKVACGVVSRVLDQPPLGPLAESPPAREW